MFLVTFTQLSPPSRVRCTSPSLLPTQMTPSSSGDSAMANNTAAYVGLVSSGVSPPVFSCLDSSFVVRSGLMTCQLCPPSVVWWTCWLPT